MRKATQQPRYIKAETICIGDTIKVTHPATTSGGMGRAYTGTVASRDRIPPFQTDYHTADGDTLLHHVIGQRPTYLITLLDRQDLESTLATLDMSTL